jgi:hypothetical protein
MRTVTTKTQKTIVQRDHDRIVFVWYENDEVVGINYHQGVDSIDAVFQNPDSEIMTMYRLAHRHKPELSDIELVNLAIRMHQDAWMSFDSKSYTIDTYSRGLIQTALQYYVDSMRSFFGGHLDADGDEAINEFNALSKLMEYNVTVTTNLGEVIDLDLSKYER